MSTAARLSAGNVQWVALSHIGMRRLNNQDSYAHLPAEDDATWMQRGHLFVVADGMGAHAAGELASKMAVESVVHHYGKHRELPPVEALLKSLRDANQEIFQRGQANTEFHNMGTTCSALVLLPQGAVVGHVGDSRIYRIRGHQIHQLTFDHSLVWEMRAAGSFPQGEAGLNIPRNVITRSLGPQPVVHVDLEGPYDVQPEDVFLLCSDGLTGRVDDDELALILGLAGVNEASQMLIDLANLRGGPDNITAIVVRAEDAGLRGRAEPLVVGVELKLSRPVPWAWWIVFLVCLFVGAGLAILHVWPAVALAGLGALTASGIAWWLSHDTDRGVRLIGGRRLGKGPYVKGECTPVEQRLLALIESVRELSEQAPIADGDEAARAQACLQESISRARAEAHTESLHLLAVAAHLLARGRGVH